MRKMLAIAVVMLFFLSASFAKSNYTCPVYKDFDDCIARCDSSVDLCAGYIGSCDYWCRSGYIGIDTDNGSEPPSTYNPPSCQNKCPPWQTQELPPSCACKDIQVLPGSTCASACGQGQTQEPAPSCACRDIPPCPQRNQSDFAEPKASGKIEGVTGLVFVYRTDVQSWCSVSPGSTNYANEGESIRVLGGTATIRFFNGNQIDVKPDSEFIIKRPKIDPDGTLTDMIFEAVKGVYHYVVPPEKEKFKKFQVQWDSVVMAPKGTEFVVQKNADETITVFLLEGELEVYSAKGIGARQNISAGQKISFTADGEPQTPQAYGPLEVEKWWGAPYQKICPLLLIPLALIAFAFAKRWEE